MVPVTAEALALFPPLGDIRRSAIAASRSAVGRGAPFGRSSRRERCSAVVRDPSSCGAPGVRTGDAAS